MFFKAVWTSKVKNVIKNLRYCLIRFTITLCHQGSCMVLRFAVIYIFYIFIWGVFGARIEEQRKCMTRNKVKFTLKEMEVWSFLSHGVKNYRPGLHSNKAKIHRVSGRCENFALFAILRIQPIWQNVLSLLLLLLLLRMNVIATL